MLSLHSAMMRALPQRSVPLAGLAVAATLQAPLQGPPAPPCPSAAAAPAAQVAQPSYRAVLGPQVACWAARQQTQQVQQAHQATTSSSKPPVSLFCEVFFCCAAAGLFLPCCAKGAHPQCLQCDAVGSESLSSRAAAAQPTLPAPLPLLPAAADGQWLFLCPLNLRMLLAHFGSYPACPPAITAKVRQGDREGLG